MKPFRRADSKYYWVKFTVNGRIYQKSTKRTNYAEAKRVGMEMMKKVLDDIQIHGKERVRLIDAIDRWLETKKGKSDYRNLVTRRNKLFGIGEDRKNGGKWKDKIWHLPTTFMLHDLDTSVISKLREARVSEGLSNNAVNLELKQIQTVYNLARNEWGYAVNPDVVWKMLPVKPKTRYLSDTEEKVLLDYIKERGDDDAHLLCMFLLDTGVRSVSEALPIRWRDVDLARGSVTIWRSKGSASDEIGLTDRLIEAFTRRKEKLESSGVVAYRQTILPSMACYRRLAKYIDAVCNDPDHPDPRGKATVHTLRDTYVSKLVRGGMTLHQASAVIGHASISMTRKYAHLERRDVKSEAIRLLNAMK